MTEPERDPGEPSSFQPEAFVSAMAWDLPPHPASEVNTREDLAVFVTALRDDFIRSGTDWENQTLDRFLPSLTD
ncbi:hypothetical protein ACFT9M_19540 [Micromonospora purpureochromogenes]|uniref:DUF7660 family protein n=1 Tax=Micromonospora purpureochromogenes TaxID=47872 RepID=UPI00362BDE8E